MVLKIAKNITIEKDGKSITLTDEELRQLVKQALGGEVVMAGGGMAEVSAAPPQPQMEPVIEAQKITQPVRKVRTVKQKPHKQVSGGEQLVHISEEKKAQIMSHVNSRMNEIPQTLSFLLEGISYVPNYLPFIRKMVESEAGVSKVMNGKRVLYFKKGVRQAPPEQVVAPAATPSSQTVINEQPKPAAVEQAPAKNNKIEIA